MKGCVNPILQSSENLTSDSQVLLKSANFSQNVSKLARRIIH